MMWYMEASFDPYGGVNKQKYVGLSQEQAKFLHAKFSNEGWGHVRSGRMEFM